MLRQIFITLTRFTKDQTMANDIYTIDLLATGTATVTVTDDGTGMDWLVFSGVYSSPTDIRLTWTSGAGASTDAMGFYFNPTGVGHRLVVNGLIENVRGSNGLDYIQGNEQNNILYGDNAASGPGGADSLYGYGGNDKVYGGAGNDVIEGASGNDVLYGDSGNDDISGGDGNDTISGGAGADSLTGGSQARDQVNYAASNAAVTVNITYGSATTGIGGHAAGDTIRGFADVVGSRFNDILTDTNSGNVGFGYNANIFNGGAGNDQLNLGGGDDRGIGGTGNDTLFGGIGHDTLDGNDGADQLIGGLGLDRLNGDAGADQFIYTSVAESTAGVTGRDVVQDFMRAEGDKINLTAIDADAAVALDQNFVWRGALAFNGVHGALRVVNYGANTLVQADLDGDKVADFSILVQGINNMVATDFLL